MKKVLYSIAFSLIIFTASAQKKFNTIVFKDFLTRSGSPSMLDYGVFAKKDAVSTLQVIKTEKAGTINISTIDSTITVKTAGAEDQLFKITLIMEEEKDKYKNKTLKIYCEDKMKKGFVLLIDRNENFRKSDLMYVSITHDNNDDGNKYSCTYLKNLLEK